MTITEIQDRLMALGWQWQEHVFNDGMHSDCFLRMTREKWCHAFSYWSKEEKPDKEVDRIRDTVIGWGRFSRQYCWEQALEWAERIERGPQKIDAMDLIMEEDDGCR